MQRAPLPLHPSCRRARSRRTLPAGTTVRAEGPLSERICSRGAKQGCGIAPDREHRRVFGEGSLPIWVSEYEKGLRDKFYKCNVEGRILDNVCALLETQSVYFRTQSRPELL